MPLVEVVGTHRAFKCWFHARAGWDFVFPVTGYIMLLVVGLIDSDNCFITTHFQKTANTNNVKYERFGNIFSVKLVRMCRNFIPKLYFACQTVLKVLVRHCFSMMNKIRPACLLHHFKAPCKAILRPIS